jgi:hypothetical protein
LHSFRNGLLDGAYSEFALLPGLNWIQVVPANGTLDDTWSTKSHAISTNSDREFLFAARAASDLILTTAKTAVTEGYVPSRFATIAVIDRGGTYTPPPSQPDRHPIFVDATIDAAKMRVAPAEYLLLESGRTFARSALPNLSQLLITVAGTSDTTDATERALELSNSLGAINWRITKLLPLADCVIVALLPEG